MFNCLNAGYWGFTSQLFGNVPEADKVLTYAASCGSTRYDELPVKVAEQIRETFRKVSAFSVRDQNTHEFVAKLSDRPINDHLDPVLIYNFDREVEDADLPVLPQHFCVVYSYYNRIHTTEEIHAIKSFCKAHQLTPVAIGAPQFWLKDYIVCSPFQCLKIFRQADFVITDTFHGTIFSAKYAKRFAILARASNKNKLLDLVKRIGVEDHLLSNLNELEAVCDLEHDKESFRRIIEAEKKKSEEYLEQNINGAK